MKELIKKAVIWALTQEAKFVLGRKKPYIIAVTGNLGKTSTKDAVYTVLKESFHVRRSEKSLNSEFGVPLTILGEKSGWSNPFAWIMILYRGLFVASDEDYPTHLVLEVGADKPGDIENVVKWLHPDSVILTQFAEVPVHVEFFRDREHLIAEKAFLPKALKETGLFIYCADDIDNVHIAESINRTKISVGITHTADIHGEGVTVYGKPVLEGTKARVSVDGIPYEIILPEVVGKSSVYAVLPALAMAKVLQVPLAIAVDALRGYEKPKGRMRLLHGMNKSTIIDDTYNASPKAAEHGLKTLASLDASGKKIAVLGDMMELGDFTKTEHQKIGAVAAASCHKLITVGIRSRFTAEGALNSGMRDENIFECESAVEAGRELVSLIEPGDIIYIKGSQSMRMERAVKMILADVHDPKGVLVRQDPEWLKRK